MSRLVELLLSGDLVLIYSTGRSTYGTIFINQHIKPTHRARSGLERTYAEIGVNEEIDTTHDK